MKQYKPKIENKLKLKKYINYKQLNNGNNKQRDKK